MKIVGLMSGTSMDGIDAALVEIEGDGGEEGRGGSPHGDTPGIECELLAFRETPYEEARRRRIAEAVEGRASMSALCRLHRDLGLWLAEAVEGVCREAGIGPSELDLVGSHGHTVWHDPPLRRPAPMPEKTETGKGARGERSSGLETGDPPGPGGSSLQLGNPAVVVELVGVPVVSDFRSADLAAGGQGAPLVPFADRLLFSAKGRKRALQNLGGMGNVTWLPELGSGDEILAFDTGPGVALLDAAAGMATGGESRFDRGGRLAKAGSVDPSLLDRLMEDPFFDESPPRSTGRERFGAPLVRDLARERGLEPGETTGGWPDLLATLAAFTARSIGDAYRRWVLPRGVDEVFLTGGGARHPVLVREIRRELDPLPVRPGAELGLDPDAREAVAFAVLAWAHVRGIPGNVPSSTGARGPRILGSYSPATRRAS